MLFYLALIISAYALARLYQVPMESAPTASKEEAEVKARRLLIPSLVAAVVIIFSLWHIYTIGAASADTFQRLSR